MSPTDNTGPTGQADAPGDPGHPDAALDDLARLCALLRDQLEAARAEIDRQDSEIVTLTRLLAEREAEIATLRARGSGDPAPRPAGLAARLLGRDPG